MARTVVADVMRTKYDAGDFGGFGPAAAFDVLDLDPAKIARAEAAIRRFNDDAVAGAAMRRSRGLARGRGCDRRHGALSASDQRHALARRPPGHRRVRHDRERRAARRPLRADAAARAAVRDLVLAHRESADFGAFGGADYSDAAGPTLHLPRVRQQIDPWAASGVSETGNAFYKNVDEDEMTRVLT